MKQYEVKTFSIPKVDGISEKAMEIHLGLYAGYVKNLNAHYATLRSLCEKGPGDPTVLSAVTRRIGFELAGVLNHECFFSALENGPSACTEGSPLHAQVIKQFGSFDGFVNGVKKTAEVMRGIGWVLVVHDKEKETLHIVWVSDHELGNVNLPVVLAVDMWEHAYLLDYVPAEKGSYVDAYLQAVNWKTVEDTFVAR